MARGAAGDTGVRTARACAGALPGLLMASVDRAAAGFVFNWAVQVLGWQNVEWMVFNVTLVETVLLRINIYTLILSFP